MNIEDKIFNRIKKTLALAKNNPSEHEAQAAMLMAQKLLAKHGLTLKDMEGEDTTEGLKKVVRLDIIEPTGRLVWWRSSLAEVIARNFKCKCFLTKYGNYEKVITFMALEEDAEIAKEVYLYAEKVADNLATKYVQKQYREGNNTKGVRNDFMKGFIAGLDEKFIEQVEKNNWGLVIVTDALVVQEFKELKVRYVNSTGVRPKFSGSESAYNEGHESGKNFGDSRNRKGIEG